MKNLGRRPGDARLSKLLPFEFRGNRRVNDLFDEFLTQKNYNRALCKRLLTVSRQRRGVPWELRRLAILMLEHQILKLDPANISEFDFLLRQLGLKPARGHAHAVTGDVLKQGYSTTDSPQFVLELHRRLQRLDHVHRGIKGRRTSDAALHDFWNCSRSECRLSLARYLLTPEEVINRIVGDLQVTAGVADHDTGRPHFVDVEIARGLRILPDFEAKILKALCDAANVYWVSKTTSSEINSLVEYPLTTVVVVIKPPGSDIEFEIKRAGRKRDNALNVVYARNSYTVPPSHRLDGGCMQWLLRFEANAAAKFSRIYRLVHGTNAPIANYVSRSTIFSVPAGETEVQTLPYFTDPQLFGSGFEQMRVAMSESVADFIDESGSKLPPLPGDLGLTAHFISHVAPAQAILCGTSSLRLDRVAAYLSPNGAQRYFVEGLSASCSKEDGRQFADRLLEEVLGSYRRPKARYRNHEQYLAAAFELPENRATANKTYNSLVQQIAKFWGTLLGVRGYSRGESFVGRNVGLKSYWDSGEWKVKIIFMDHDALAIPDYSVQNFLAQNALPEMFLDERYIWGGTNAAQLSTSAVGFLRCIYRIKNEVFEHGQVLASRGLREAYRKTQEGLLTNPKLRALFNAQFVSRLPDWDTFVTGYLQLNGDRKAAEAWKRKMKRALAAKGYRREAYDAYAQALEKNRVFVEKYQHVFDSQPGDDESLFSQKETA